MREEPNHHKPPRRKFCNRRRKFATGVAFLWLLSVSPDKAPDRPSDKRKRTKKKWGCQDSNLEPCGFEPGIPHARGGPRVLGTRKEGRSASPTLVPPAWGVPAWRGWAHCGALWCFPRCRWTESTLVVQAGCLRTPRRTSKGMYTSRKNAAADGKLPQSVYRRCYKHLR